MASSNETLRFMQFAIKYGPNSRYMGSIMSSGPTACLKGKNPQKTTLPGGAKCYQAQSQGQGQGQEQAAAYMII
jgi:hypothetical protein